MELKIFEIKFSDNKSGNWVKSFYVMGTDSADAIEALHTILTIDENPDLVYFDSCRIEAVPVADHRS